LGGLLLANTLAASGRVNLVRRLDAVRQISHKIGYGVGDHMDSLLWKYGGDRVKRRYLGNFFAFSQNFAGTAQACRKHTAFAQGFTLATKDAMLAR
jgi:hypothetical protein